MDETEDAMVELDKLLARFVGAEKELHKAGLGLLPCYPGDKVTIRTLTHTYIGEVVRIHPSASWVWLKHAAWVAEAGRWHQFVANGEAEEDEVEAWPEDAIVAVHLEPASEISPFLGKLPTTTR